MSYDFVPVPPPVKPEMGKALGWVYSQLRRISENLLYQRVGWQDLRVSLVSTKLTGAKDPTYKKIQDDGAGSQGVYAYAFDAANEEELFYEAQLPHGRLTNSDLRAHIHWMPEGTNTGIVRWGLEYTYANVGDAFPATTIIYAEDAADGVTKKHQIAAFPTITGAGVQDSAVFFCRVFRNAGHANDTFTGDAFAGSKDFHIQAMQLGSDQEYPS